ncbi:hypothetical protein PRK78_002389 [Emydomyces testavorans]|uniref:Uncharacterized protein n=1 Tax=Emydomyces testavorans TaxID=2070801 RepID=A0AAF0DFM3_9EURO|nr:hypothetical protein PRK78_002389 [Emydomyces testavorans]
MAINKKTAEESKKETPEQQSTEEPLPTPTTSHQHRTQNPLKNRSKQEFAETRSMEEIKERTEVQLAMLSLRRKAAELEKENQDLRKEAESHESSEAFERFIKGEADPASRVGRYITSFYQKVQTINGPETLTSSANYPTWKDEILLAAELAGIARILKNKEREPPHKDIRVKQLWDVWNKWLYGFISTSISAQAKMYFKRPERLIAYDLWETVESTFSEPPDLRRESLVA